MNIYFYNNEDLFHVYEYNGYMVTSNPIKYKVTGECIIFPNFLYLIEYILKEVERGDSPWDWKYIIDPDWLEANATKWHKIRNLINHFSFQGLKALGLDANSSWVYTDGEYDYSVLIKYDPYSGMYTELKNGSVHKTLQSAKEALYRPVAAAAQ